MKTNYPVCKKIVVTLLQLILIVFTAKAQTQSFCNTQSSSNSVGIIPGSLGDFGGGEGPYFLRIYVNVIRLDNGNGGLPDEDAKSAIEILNQDFNSHGIYFVWDCSINYIDNTLIYYQDICNLFYPGWVFSSAPHSDGIDIYFFDDEWLSCGRAEDIPSSAFYVSGGFSGEPNVTYANSHIVSHEMGHCLGLWHTFHGTGENGLDNPCPELVNGSNCNICGDYVCDTPADPNMGFDVDFPHCEWNGSGNDSNETAYDPDELNIMSYSNPSCMEYFTPDQGKRMRQMISFSSVLQDCLVDPEYYSHTINSTSVWTTSNTPNNGNFLIEDELVIESGATLTIDNGVIVRFGHEGRIVIQPNANLILAGTLTGQGCGISWKGIEVWGNSNESQYTIDGVKAQGSFIGKNGAIVENAETAVKLYGPSYTNHAGGQINCTGTIFRNNTIAVQFAPYKNFWPYPTPQYGQPRNYFGSFTSCNFENNNDYAFTEGFHSFLFLTGVNGVQVIGSNFTNSQNLPGCSTVMDYGYGIFATDSGFSVQAKCTNNSYPCNNFQRGAFFGLGYGIHTSTVVNNKPYLIKQTDFSNCYFGLKSNATSNGTILFNNFLLGNVPDVCVNNGEQLGVFFETGIAGFTMQENEFKGETGNVSTTVGVLCKNMGQFNNVIRRNNYINLDFGNVGEGENASSSGSEFDRGLHYLCNKNININQVDFAVSDDLSVNRIRQSQGLEVEITIGSFEYKAAGNQFSYGTGLDFNNQGDGVDYYYRASSANQTPINTSGDFTSIQSDENTCFENYCEPPCKTEAEIALEKEKYYQSKTEEIASRNEWTLATNMGNTILAAQSKKATSYYRQKMDEHAYVVIQHLLYDTINFQADTLAVWLDNLGGFEKDISNALRLQSDENYVLAQACLERVAKRRDLSDLQRADLQEVPLLLSVLNRKSPFALDKPGLQKIEQLAVQDLSLTGIISRNILSLYGYEFAPSYSLPKTSERIEAINLTNTHPGKQEIMAYPNPNKGTFNFIWRPEYSQLEKARLTVTDLSGRIIHIQNIFAFNNQVIKLTDIHEGIYFYQLQVEGEPLKIGKLIIR